MDCFPPRTDSGSELSVNSRRTGSIRGDSDSVHCYMLVGRVACPPESPVSRVPDALFTIGDSVLSLSRRVRLPLSLAGPAEDAGVRRRSTALRASHRPLSLPMSRTVRGWAVDREAVELPVGDRAAEPPAPLP